MKKYLYLTVGLLFLPMVAGAECVGGTWITANSMTNNPNGNCTAEKCNGETFCKSNGTMNWWSAFTWCASNGLHLVKFQEACPGIPTSTNTATGACPNLQETGGNLWVWTELAPDGNSALTVYLSNGMVGGRNRNSDVIYTLCK